MNFLKNPGISNFFNEFLESVFFTNFLKIYIFKNLFFFVNFQFNPHVLKKRQTFGKEVSVSNKGKKTFGATLIEKETEKNYSTSKI